MPIAQGAVQQQRAGVPTQQGSAPAPVGGWNTRDALAAMPAGDAVMLENFFPDEGKVTSRKGFEEYATGLASDVETLIEYHSGTTRHFLAASGAKLYTINTSGAATEIATGYSNARWQGIQHNTKLVLCNGADAPQEYDGSTVSTVSLSGTGLTTTNLVGVTSFKGRAIYWENNSGDFWYAASGSYSGTLTKFQLGQIARRGGTIISIVEWTRDGGSGPDDYAVFFMSTGETLVYQGTDPGDAANWALVGRYDLGAPVSIRGVAKFAGDVYVMTQGDFVSLTQLLQLGNTASGVSKLSGAAASAVRSYGSNYGWQAVIYPRGNMALFNIPVAEGVTYHQYGFNTITGAPFKFTGQNARCWGVFNNRLYFGGNTKVYLADEGYNDDGIFIDVDAQDAFTFLGGPLNKRVTGVSPVLDRDGNVALNIGVAYDYGSAVVSQEVSTETTGLTWDDFYWDDEYWSPEDTNATDNYSISGAGKAVSIRIKASLKGQQLTWYRTDYLYQPLSRF